MASAAEQIASNVNWSAFSKAEELQRRIWFTLGALVVYRLGTFIPIPGIDPIQLARIMEQQTQGMLGMFNLLSGGAVERMAIFALNVMPYISASIIMQVMTTVSPQLERMKKEGESGRKMINQYTRYLTVLLAAVQSFAIASGLGVNPRSRHQPGPDVRTLDRRHVDGRRHVPDVAGRTDHLARHRQRRLADHLCGHRREPVPRASSARWRWQNVGTISWISAMGLYVLVIAVIMAIVFMERAQRRLAGQYPKRQVGNRLVDQQSSHLPLKINTSGVIPPIFASSLLVLPITIASFNAQNAPEWLTEVGAPAEPRPAALHAGSMGC